MAGKVKIIPATKDRFASKPITSERKRRVAAYARVSTDEDEQLNSYAAQVSYYEEYIRRNPDWEFAGIYSDEGISGTHIQQRTGFRKMLDDALIHGKIDLILTKSVSRFARNTVDTLTSIRELKAKGVEVYFEKENIWTFDSKGEMLLTIMSSIAQEESRSISENVLWSVRKKFENGDYWVNFSRLLGFERGEDGSIA
ncbi:MAG: recombinase family protein, partial [Bullifex sp.]